MQINTASRQVAIVAAFSEDTSLSVACLNAAAALLGTFARHCSVKTALSDGITPTIEST